MVRRPRLSLAIPASLVSDFPHLREKTLRIGIVGRVAAIFGVEELIIYLDDPKTNQKRDANLISIILSYMETPQYLRKRLFKIRPELKYVGVLPPLRTRHHPLANRTKHLINGEYREGVAVSHVRHGTMVDIGVERPILVRGKKIQINSRVTVEVKKTAKLLEGMITSPSRIMQYWGYKVNQTGLTLGKLLETKRTRALPDLVLATSKFGEVISKNSELKDRIADSEGMLVIFGSPSKSLYEIAKHENLNLDDITDFVINTVPCQKVETVRTEEAILVTLGILNLMTAKD